jgi:hypothetical protein
VGTGLPSPTAVAIDDDSICVTLHPDGLVFDPVPLPGEVAVLTNGDEDGHDDDDDDD